MIRRQTRGSSLRSRSSPERPGRLGFPAAALSWGLAAILLSGLLLSAVPAAAQRVAAIEPRPRVDLREPPWRGVGKLQATAGSLRMTCTGALVGSRTVLTAAHCLANARTGRDHLPSSIHFLAGFEGQSYAASATAIELIKGRFDPADPAASRGGDWALIVLDAPIGTADRRLAVSQRPPQPGAALMIGGYAVDNPNVLTADTNCKVTGYTADGQGRPLIRHDCRTAHGISGAPLFMWTGFQWSVAGVNVALSRVHADGLAVLRNLAWGQF
jgi:protease YdgD